MFDLVSELRRQHDEIINPLKISKGLPLDVRYLVSTLDNLATELPLMYRYYGLIFFVADTGKFYYFGKDLTKPLSFSQEIINTIVTNVESVDKLMEIKDHILDGQIVFVKALNANFQKKNTDFIYHSGALTGTRNEILELPDSMKSVGVKFLNTDDNQNYTIELDNSGSKVIVEDKFSRVALPQNGINNKIYKTDGNYFVFFEGNYISLGTSQQQVIVDLIRAGHDSFPNVTNSRDIALEFYIDNQPIHIEAEITQDEIYTMSWKELRNVKVIFKYTK